MIGKTKIILLGSLLATELVAQGDSTFPMKEKENQKITSGWDKFVGLGLYGTMSENSNVVGKDNGVSTTVGGKLEGSADYRQGSREWRNQLNLMTTYTRTPLIPRYIKTEDNLSINFCIYFLSLSISKT